MTETQTLLCHSRKRQISGPFFFVNENSGIEAIVNCVAKQRQLYIDYGRVDRRHSSVDTKQSTEYTSDDDGWSMTIPILNKINREIIIG